MSKMQFNAVVCKNKREVRELFRKSNRNEVIICNN